MPVDSTAFEGPTALRVVVATDVVDSTALGQRAGSDALWEAHDRAARDLIREHGGREIGRTDGIFALFDDVLQALAFARGYHLALAALMPPMQARVGVHAGPATLRRNAADDVEQGAIPFEIDGPVLPVAVRIMSVASGGQTLLSADAMPAQAGARFVGHGHWRLKGVEAPLELVEAVWHPIVPRLPADSEKAFRVVQADGAWLPARRGPGLLPAERSAFVAREELLDRLARHLDADARLVTLLGPGGIGKTRLALRFARLWSAAFKGGAWFCDLSAARTSEGLWQALAQTLDVPLAGSEPEHRLGLALAGRGRCLVIVDNMEQLVEPARRSIAAWLALAPEARLVATSRVRISLPEEQLLAVGPLSPIEGEALFAQRAGMFGVHWGPDDRQALPSLIERLDGLPLSIELAAARARIIPPRRMLEQMDRRLRLLSLPGNPDGDRQATLRATIDGSWELLAPTERSVLAQAAVFEGGFSLPAAEAVIVPDAASPDHWIADSLQRLVDHSLLVHDDAADRFRMLSTLQEYARERLGAEPRWRVAEDRHRDWFARRSEVEVLGREFADLENLVAACERSVAQDDAEAAAQTLALAAEVLLVRGPVQRLLALADPVAALDGLTAPRRAEVLRVRGNVLYSLGRAEEAVVAYRQGIELAEAVPGLEAAVRLACAIAVPLARSGAKAEARTRLDQAAVQAAHLPAVRRCAVLNAQGMLALAEQSPGDAVKRFEAALPLAREAGHRRWEGGLLGNLGAALYSMGQAEPARERFAESMRVAQEIGDRLWASNAACNLGLLLVEAGDPGAAEPLLRTALATAREIGQAPLEATAACNLGLLLIEAGRAAEALEPLAQAARLAMQLADTGLLAQCRGAQGRALASLDRRGEALGALQEALKLAAQASDATEQVRCCCALAALDTAGAPGWVERAERLVEAVDPSLRVVLAREVAAARAALAG